jgi:protein-L-isoaspartate(D-aspartate) O-methyltransferase
MHRSSSTAESFIPSQFAQQIVARAGIIDEATELELMKALTVVDRQKYLVTTYAERANEDESFPIGFKQDSLRPSTLVRLIGLLGVKKGMRILEIGTGSGYGAALMLTMGAEVFCIEKEGLFAQQTRKKLDASGFSKILFKAGDGRKGWSEMAPFDGIIMTFPSEAPSPEVLSQLRLGGRLVGGFGAAGSEKIHLYEKGDALNKYELEGWAG